MPSQYTLIIPHRAIQQQQQTETNKLHRLYFQFRILVSVTIKARLDSRKHCQVSQLAQHFNPWPL